MPIGSISGPSSADRHPGAEVGGRRREHVAAVEGRSRGVQPVLGVGQLDRPCRAADHADGGCQQTVVRADEHRRAVADLDRHGPARRSDPGIDHGQHDAGRQVLRAASEGQPAGPDVMGRDLVADVDDERRGRDLTDHRLHDADELVVEP